MKDNTIIDKLENLKVIREKKHITQVKLAIDLEVSQELISRYELGNSFPQPNMLIKLANYFNCSVDYLLGRTNIATPINILALDKTNMEYASIIEKYNALSDEGKKELFNYINYLIDKK